MIISVWKCKGKLMNSPWKQVLTKLFPMMFNINFFKYLLLLIILVNLAGCGGKATGKNAPVDLNRINAGSQATHGKLSQQVTEVSPPVVIQRLQQKLEVHQPQVQIISPKSEEVLQDNSLKVKFSVKDLPVFKNPQLGLGPHLQVILDNEQYQEVYDLDHPLEIPNLSAGTHTLRVFASTPWYESFKNEGAYDQVKFHVFTKSDRNNPDPELPLLTYSRPEGDYGAEPILLDFYLTNAPLHLVAREKENEKIGDWRIRCTVNGESFILDRWHSLYLKGFKSGKNWVKLEFLDGKGEPVKNVFNSTIRTITYDPKGKDTLAQITRGELKTDELLSIIDPKYLVKEEVTKTAPAIKPIPKVETKPVPVTKPAQKVEAETQQVKQPVVSPPVAPSAPKAIPSPTPEVKLTPSPSTSSVTPKTPKETFQTSSEVIKSPAVESAPQTKKPNPEKITPDKIKSDESNKEFKPEPKTELESKPNSETDTKVTEKAEVPAKSEKADIKAIPQSDQKTPVLEEKSVN